MTANNVTRLLESRGIPFQAFELAEEKRGALETARALGVDPAVVYKTIVIAREKAGKPILAVVPGTAEVSLKKLALLLEEKKLRLTSLKEAEQMTGLRAGGISPLALIHKGFAVVIDERARQHAEVHVSGGQLGLNIRLPVAALAELVQACFGDISQAAAAPQTE